MLKKFPKTKIMDSLHRYFVYGCMAITLAATFDLGYMGFQYYFHIKPAKKAEALRIQQELLQEGTADVAGKIAA